MKFVLIAFAVGFMPAALATPAAKQPPEELYEFKASLHVLGEEPVDLTFGGTLGRDKPLASIHHGLLDPNEDHTNTVHGLSLEIFVSSQDTELEIKITARTESRTEPQGAAKTSNSRVVTGRSSYTKQLPLSGSDVTVFTSRDGHYELVLERFGPISREVRY